MVDFGAIVVSLLCGRRGMLAAFHLGRSLNKRQRLALDFTKGVTPRVSPKARTSVTSPSTQDDARQQGRRRPCEAWVVGVLRGSAIHSRQRGLAREGHRFPMHSSFWTGSI